MPQFEKFTRENIKELNSIIQQELKAIGEKYAIRISLGDPKITGMEEFETKIKVSSSAVFYNKKSE